VVDCRSRPEIGLRPRNARAAHGVLVSMIDSRSPRHPALAAFLSFLFPGLGQAYAGSRRLAALFALPVALLILVALGMLLAGGSRVLNSVLSASFLTALVVLDVALLAWRLLAIGQVGLAQPASSTERGAFPVQAAPGSTAAMASTGTHLQLPSARRAGTVGVVAVLMAATIVMHAWAGLLLTEINTTLGDVFGGQQNGEGSGHGLGNGHPLNRPEYAWNGTERINFLLLGIDSGPGRDEALTDTILAVSVDPVAKTAVMVSVPRDTVMTPLPDRSVYPDGLYPNKINALSTEAGNDPARWCPDMPAADGNACGLRTLERTVGLYLGIDIQYYATIDLEGFTHLIDAIGPLRLCLDGTLDDPTYQGPGDTWTSYKRGIVLQPGCAEYDGIRALAYARARKGTLTLPDGTVQVLTDFMRADRQQEVLLEMRREFAKLDLFFELPRTLQAVGATVHTDFPRDKAGDLASLMPLITGPDIKRVVLGVPRYVDAPADLTATYVLTPRRDDIRRLMRRLFGADGLQGWYLATRSIGPEG
jgi:LCP family protein required for cell wall assembly